MPQRTENISNLLHESPPFFIFPTCKGNAGKVTLLFGSALVAREVAYMLRGDWDGLNAVTIYQPDMVAVKNALALLKLELGLEEVNYCHAREYCSVLVLPPIQIFSTARSGKSVLMAEFLMQFSTEGIGDPE
ncbi:hypothetical protein [Chlorogloea sp. CCALA 695]|uniref:hypothetical protein n=1 Tax=Chlorogloea sp. CCALA 695 TaxID=2107693 RepID=UPI000D07E394|nr:hypothetical protein [Chlorogloea sp. CCALA 695]PSB27623.1 hypothetical protein C7B70_22110 [Chlorogloea sp. CCALA 695]